MNWENVLDTAGHWSKWLLGSFCLSHVYFSLMYLPTPSIILVVGSTGLIIADWVSKQRK